MPGAAYEVRVAGSVADIASAPAVATGTVAVGGYHTVPLEQPAAVTAGRVFVVAVRVTAPGWARPVPVERTSELIAPRAGAGQSYVSADGASWKDLTALAGLSHADVCLKAFVDAPGAGDTQPPCVDVDGGVVRRGATAAVRWRLSDPAFSSASAIVVLKVRDARGGVRREATAPGRRGGRARHLELRATWPAGPYRSPAGPTTSPAGGSPRRARRPSCPRLRGRGRSSARGSPAPLRPRASRGAASGSCRA